MTGSRASHIFLDANTALHFKRPDQIDWQALTGCKEVVLIAAPVLHREIEHQKIHNPSAKLRKRADAYIRWLVAFVRDGSLEVRPGVKWRFIPTEPQIDFRENKLSLTIADDQLIASVIEYEPPKDTGVLVATADIGLEIKLHHRGITPLLLPDDAKLPEAPDPQEKELLELRRKIAQKHLPALELATATSGHRHPFKIGPPGSKLSVVSPTEMRLKHPSIDPPQTSPQEKNGQPSFASFYHQTAEALRDMFLSPERIENFNRERQHFLEKYDAFYQRRVEWEEQIALSAELDLTLSNTGTAPATDIDVILHFPDDLTLLKADDLPDMPKEPQPPIRPDNFRDLHSAAFHIRDYSGMLRSPQDYLPDLNIDGVTIDTNLHQVNYSLRTLKHRFTDKIEAVYFRFPDRRSVRQFNVEYEISCAELPEPITGKLHFVNS